MIHAFKENAKLFTRVAVLFYIPISNVRDCFSVSSSAFGIVTMLYSLVLSSFSFIVLYFAFKSMIHFKLIFVPGVSFRSRLILLLMDI